MPECDDIWERSEFKKRGDPSSGAKDWQSDLDLKNNAIGRGIVGDCYGGCAQSLKNGHLKCSKDDGKTTSACK
jgi:hypothetical protein